MTLTASLPMYNLPAMRSANQAFWAALAERLRREGVADVPERLDSERAPVPKDIGPEVLFTQTCGYPLQTLYAGQYRLVARPTYSAPGCVGSTHCAFLIVAEHSPARRVEDLRGGRFALNSLNSNSGMSLPRRLIADHAQARPFFGEVIRTGGHGPSLKLVAAGGADVCSVDCLTFAFFQDYEPDTVAGLRVLAETPPSPTIPFVTSIATSEETLAALRRALFALSDAPAARPVLDPLRIMTIEPAPEVEYGRILNYVREAADLGYPDLI
jgi:ABC-type phosphate/phosphonate transport system substrate-binding protein